MHAIRFAQYAILTMTAALAVFYFSVTSAGHLIFTKLLGFGQDSSLKEQIAADPLVPTLFAIAISVTLLLEAFRLRLQKKKISSN